jgi:hypothetical protein
VELWSCGAVELWSSYLIFWGSDYLKKISKYLFTSGKKQRRTKKKHREEDAWSIPPIDSTRFLRKQLAYVVQAQSNLLCSHNDDHFRASKIFDEPMAELRPNLQVCVPTLQI